MAILAIRGLKLVIQIDEHMVAEAGDTWCFNFPVGLDSVGVLMKVPDLTYPELDETPSTYSR